MKKYQLRFWFEHCGPCLWGMNDKAKKKYGYAIRPCDLPLSKELINELGALEQEYHTYLNWDCPSDPSPWTEAHKKDFLCRATMAFHKLEAELGAEYEVLNETQSCVL